jgi:cell division protein FtsQ
LVLSLLVGRGGAPALLRLPGADKLLAWSGLGIEQVSVVGHRFTPDADIFEAIDHAGTGSLLSFDSAEARARIERLPWVASARIARVFPGSLDVRITERSPAALWTSNGSDYLIDADGRMLAAVEPGMGSSLPHVAGKGAATQARALIDLVKHYPRIAERFERAERIGERRWTLRLKGGITLHLAADREAAAFAMLSSPDDLGGLLSAQNVIIDLRTPGRVTVRPDPPRTDAPAASTPQSQARS